MQTIPPQHHPLRIPPQATRRRNEPQSHQRDADMLGGPARLRVIAGIHAGADRALAEGELLLVGSGGDCDLVLSDAGVARHHCLLSMHGDGIRVRAVEAAVVLDDRRIAPGDPVCVPPMQPLRVGEAALAVGADDDSRWEALLAPPVEPAAAAPSPPPQRRRAWIPLTLVGVSLVSLAIASSWRSQPTEEEISPRSRLVAVLDSLDLDEVRGEQSDQGRMLLTGVVPTAGDLAELESALRQAGVEVHMGVRTGDDIANDVREVLRLSGLNAQTSYLGDGRVQVEGVFPDEDALEQAATSRAMAEISGLTEVLTHNHATRPRAKASTPDAKKVVATVEGKDPYLITRDGSRYYIGATLPDGGTLEAIEGDRIVVLDDGRTRKRRLKDVELRRM